MSKTPYFSQYVSPNILIVPTVCCYGPPPKKPKLDKNVSNPTPGMKLINNVSKQSVKNQTCKNSASTKQECQQNSKQCMQTSHQNELIKQTNEKDVNKNSSDIENLNKTTKQGSASWASNYLQTIGQVKKPIKLNLKPLRKKRTISKEGNQPLPSTCNIMKMNFSEEPKKTSNDEEGKSATSTLDYQKHFYLQNTGTPPTVSSKNTNVSSENTGTLVNQINTNTKRVIHTTKLSSIYDVTNITQHDKIIKPKTLNNTKSDCQIAPHGLEIKSSIDNNKKLPKSLGNKPIPIQSSAILRNTEDEEKRERDLSKTKSVDFSHAENKKSGEKTKSDNLPASKTSKPIKHQSSDDSSKSRKIKPATKSTTSQGKNERSSKPLQLAHFIENSNLTDKKINKTKSSKPTRVHDKEEKYDKNRKGSTKIKKDRKDHAESTSAKFQDFSIKKKHKKDTLETSQAFGIKKKYKKDTLESKDKTKTKSQNNSKPSKTFSNSSKVNSFDDRRSSSKESIKSVVQVSKKSEIENSVYKHKIDENFDLRTKLSNKSLNHYFTRIRNAFNKESNPKEKRENLIITVQNEKEDDQQMESKDIHKTSPAKDSKLIGESKICKKIKVVINLICNQSVSNKPEDNENSGLTNDDLSFLDDFNVDEIVETLKHCENESHGTKKNVDINIEVHTGLGKTNPVSLDISDDKSNDIVHETRWTIERSYIGEFSENCSVKSPPQKQFTVQVPKLQIPNVKIEASHGEHNEKVNNVDAAVDTIATTLKEQSDKVIQPFTVHNNAVQLEDTVVKTEYVETIEDKMNKCVRRVGPEPEIFKNKMPLIVNIKKEPGIENIDLESDKTSKENFVNGRREDKESDLLETVQIKSEPVVLSEFILSLPPNNLKLSQKLCETGSNKTNEKPDNDLPEATNIDVDTTHDDDDNASVDTLVLSPPHFDDISLTDLSNELNIENFNDIENNVKIEMTEIERTVQGNSNALFSTDLSNDISIKNVSEKENHLETENNEIQTAEKNAGEPSPSIVPTTQNLADDLKSTGSEPSLIATKGDILCISDTDKCGKRKNYDLQNGSKIKVVKEEDCVNNTNTAKIGKPQTNKTQTDSNGTDKKELEDKQQESKNALYVESNKVFVQNLEHRMLSYLSEQYTITSVIHKGKFSEIFHCKNSSNKDFAVKVIKCEFNRFNLGILKEKMLMQLQKEIPRANYHCAYIFNGFSLTGFWCFLMEYYPKNLMQVINDKEKPFHVDAVQHLARQLVAAVIVLRNNNIVHSDIRPSHILLNYKKNRLKLCGFDSSYHIECVELVPNIGTISYRAPEIILGFSAGFSIDVWSTALVLYEMATGTKLFPGIYNNDILFKQMCTLGNIPFDMIENSLYKDRHYCGQRFMRRVGRGGKNHVLVNEFIKSNRLRSTIFNQYNRHWNKTPPMRRSDNMQKLESLCNLLENMLILHPNYRLPIEFVYSNPFIYDNSYDKDDLFS